MKENIERIERAIFILECKDHWNDKDYAEYNRLNNELRELKANA